jgi:hypothetical protein
MSFLENLGNSLLSTLNDTAGISDNLPRSFNFDEVANLPIDRSAARNYVDSGMVRNIKPKSLEVMTQQPDITVLVKKKQFSSLIENYRFDLMNEEEKLYIRAVKRLFYNKCRAIAAFERLSKIEKIVVNSGPISDYALPLIFSSVDVLNSLSSKIIDDKTMAVLNTVRKVKVFSDPAQVTTWLVNKEIPYVSDAGEGTGVFELTTVQSLNVTNSIKFGGGSASFNIEDPYKLFVITSEDIETALSESSGFFANQFFRSTEIQLEDSINSLKQSLRDLRFSRGASDIKITVNENTLLSKKVRAFIEEAGKEIIFTFDAGALGFGASVDFDQSAFDGPQGLNGAESSLLSQVLKNIYILLGLKESTKINNKEQNSKNNYVRQKLFLDFNGQPIIQPMDVIHVYISSKTKLDNQITRGLNVNFAANSLLTGLNDSIGEINSGIDDLISAFGGAGSGQSYLETEKNSIVGPEFPSWLWYMMRNDFTRQAAGTHVFGGVVDSSSHEGSPGHYGVKVSAKDNTYYFTLGQVNLKPSMDVYDSALYDPLTPFKLDYDSGTGFLKGGIPELLDENIDLLKSGSVKLKAGRFRGSPVDENSWKITDAEVDAGSAVENIFRKKFNNPDGFVYRWKKGIGAITLFGQPHSDLFKKEAVPPLTTNPFAGQDVMNVLSLLITGKPYNFNTFLEAAIASATLSKNDLTNQGASNSYLRSLVSDLSKNNTSWGNFIPFKQMIVNDSGYNFLRSGQFDLVVNNQRVTELLQERAAIFDQISAVVPDFADNPQFYKKSLTGNLIDGDNISNQNLTSSLLKLASDIIDLDGQIDAELKQFNDGLSAAKKAINSSDGTLRIVGNEISFDPTVADDSSLTPQDRARQRIEFRKKINFLTQRRLWQVKANEDHNLFIVDDSYDKNYDIQAFEKSIGGNLQNFKSTYAKTSEQISLTADLLGLEVFADSQGHIQARPPRYNRIPSSVFFDLIHRKKTQGIQIFPSFLESLFFNQVQGTSERIEIIEDEIRLRAAALGYITDPDISTLLNGAVGTIGASGSTNFSFVTRDDGKIGGDDFRNLLMQSHPDFMEDSQRKALTQLASTINGPFNNFVSFDTVQRTKIINTQEFKGLTQDIEDKIEEIRLRLESKTGIPAKTKKELLPQDRSLLGKGRSQADILELTQQISQFLSERQYLIKLLSNAVRNLDQGTSLNKDQETGDNVLYPNLNTQSKDMYPEIIEHMIEDEQNDDLGDGSGKRYVIREVEILNRSIEPTPPDFTIVEVNGSLATGLVSGPSGLDVGSNGNGIAYAAAVDYDLWRQFGFRGTHPANTPFFSESSAQCAPYGVFLLNQARKNILKGSVTRIGNEFTQAGEVYYLEDDNLLFYAESVTHSFTYGQQYTTSLNLTYGHSPGEFIPTMLDIIGKGLYSNKHQANLIKSDRNSNASGDIHLTTLITDNTKIDSSSGDLVSNTSATTVEQIVTGTYGDQNRKNLLNMIQQIASILTPTKLGDQVKVQLRIYYNSDKQSEDIDVSEVNELLKEAADGVISWLTNPTTKSVSLEEPSLVPDTTLLTSISKDVLQVVAIDLAGSDSTKSPSGEAWTAARSLTKANGNLNYNSGNDVSSISSDLINLFSKVIDIWATFETPSVEQIKKTESSDVTNTNISQDQSDKRKEYLDNIKKALNVK